MKFKLLILIFLLSLSFYSFSQNIDSQKYSIPDTSVINSRIDNNSAYNISLDEKVSMQASLQTQKLLKNLFLAGFVFMSLIVVVLIYINNSKIKQILNMIKIQEKQIDLKNFETEKMSIILNSTFDAISIIDTTNTILWCNNSFLNIFGFTKDEITNKPLDFFTSEDSNISELINKAKNDQKPVQFSFSIKNKNGDELFIQRRIIPIVDKKNEIENFAIVDTDFTALKIALGK